MLERAARCLDSASRPALRHASKAILHSKRCLHQEFWHHGAGDLGLLPGYLPTKRALFEPPAPDSTTTSPPSSEFLDFLYPPKTKAYLRRLHHESSPTRTSRRSRRFTSVAQHAFPEPSSTSVAVLDEAVLASADPEELQHWRALEHHMERHRQGFIDISFDDAWTAYQLLPPKLKNVAFIQQVINLFASSDRTVDARRVLELFDMIPLDQRTVADYHTTILVYLKLQRYGKAVMLFHDCFGIDGYQQTTEHIAKRLLNVCIDRNYWQLALRVWRTFFIYARRATAFDFPQWRRLVFADVSTLSDYPDKVCSMVSLFAVDPESLKYDFVRREFVFAAVNAVFDNGLEFGPERTQKLLEELAKMGLSRTFWYNSSILSATKYPLDARDRLDHALSYLELYKRQELATSLHKSALSSLLLLAIECGDVTEVRNIWSEWQNSYGTSLRVGVRVSLMTFLSKCGSIREVEQLYEERSHPEEKPDNRLLYPLLRAQAFNAGPDAVRRKMEDLQHTVGLQPDITCHNILLHSYVKNEDYDGAMTCFQSISEKGMDPNNMTLGIMMTLCAHRGDVSLVQEFMSRMQEKSIRDQRFANSTLIEALLKNGDLEMAQRLAIENTESLSKQFKTNMWNAILAAYAIHGQLGPILRVSQHMKAHQIALDSLSYAAFMRVYIVRRDLTRAQSIFTNLINHKTIKPLAFHYALMIEAYANEYQFEVAYRINADMLNAGVEPTVSSKAALLRLQMIVDRIGYHRTTDGRRLSNLPLQLERSEELLEELIADERERSSPQPSSRSSSAAESTLVSAFIPGTPRLHAYFDVLLSEYSSRQAYGAMGRLLRRYEQATGSSRSANDSKKDGPLSVISSLMEIRLAEGKHDEMDQLWQLALMTAQRLMRSRSASDQSSGSGTRRTMLASHFDRYVKSLQARGQHIKILDVYETMARRGLSLDYLNTNKYVQALLSQRKTIEAFKFCEDQLIQGFTAWHHIASSPGRMKIMTATGRRERGLEWFLRPARRFDKTIPRVTVYTLQLFARVLKELTALLRHDRSSQTLLEELMRVAPKTVAAAQAMPRRLALPDVAHPSSPSTS